MISRNTGRPVLAITYREKELVAGMLLRIVERLRAAGVTCAGFLQRDEPPSVGRSRCDMFIECLASGERLKISEDRGAMARGCRLDASVLTAAIVKASDALCDGADVLVVNKFGKTEAEGGGFRQVIADAIGGGIPVIIAVPWRNIESWRAFGGDLAVEISVEEVSDLDFGALIAAIGPKASAVIPKSCRDEPITAADEVGCRLP